jgi:hypothetical protein
MEVKHHLLCIRASYPVRSEFSILSIYFNRLGFDVLSLAILQVAISGTRVQVLALSDSDVVERTANGGVRYVIEERCRPNRAEEEREESQDSSNG